MKRVLLSCCCFLAIGLALRAQPLRLWYRQPARIWTEALPIGNGRLGAMIFGGVGEEHLQFNESTLWSGRPRAHARAGAADWLGPIRSALAEGKQAEAEAMAEKHFMGLKDPDEDGYAQLKADWFRKVRKDTSWSGAVLNDADWKTMTLPTPDGWEKAGLEGLDGSVWFRAYVDLPAGWEDRELVLDLGRIRDLDYTYVNGQLVGTSEGISKKRVYVLKRGVCKPGRNAIAIQVINFDDKGGLIGIKEDRRTMVVKLKDGDAGRFAALPSEWRYKVQDAGAPPLPKYEADYQPFGDLYMAFGDTAGVTNYRRSLDIGEAMAAVSYDRQTVHYTREYFASVPQRSIVMRLAADKRGVVNIKAWLRSPHRGYSVWKVDDETIGMRVKPRNGVLQAVCYLHVRAKRGTLVVTSDGKVMVKAADEVVLYLNTETGKLPAYPVARATHVKEYRSFYDRFSIGLGAAGAVSTASDVPTDERIQQYTAERDPGLVALYLQYGRYLLISSSRPGSPLPANLQGIWNDQLTPPWGSKYTTNINLEMNYWPAELLGLSDCSMPLFKMMRGLSAEGAVTARSHYGASGWVLHHNTDRWLGTAPINAANHGIWVTGGAWLCHQIWEHYLFTKDTSFLRSYYPVMKGAAQFFLDFLVKDQRTGWLISSPSNSPEHGGLVAGPTMDHQIIRDLLTNCAAASAALHLDQVWRKEVLTKCAQIAPNQIGRYGQLQEWLEDKDDTADTHRHVSHLWGVYPGTDISYEKSAAMMAAARQSLLYRGDEGTGWSLAWKLNLWARFGDGDHALTILNRLLSPAITTAGGERGGVYPNLFDAHPPFQIDGNFGGAAGIGEMLVQSQGDAIELLPALPRVWQTGYVKGMRARGGFVIDLSWAAGRLTGARIKSSANRECVLRYGGKELRIPVQKGGVYTIDADLRIADGPRTDILLNDGWRSVMEEKDTTKYRDFASAGFDDAGWPVVDVPHNWDAYGGYRRLRHGNLHGSAWYRRRMVIARKEAGKRYFVWFEGVGSYANVWMNGVYVGAHAGGRTGFTLEVTDALRAGENVLAVRSDHPAGIRDLPWVCGGCSDDRGFSEGSQPMGVFRPVHLVVTNAVRVAPFGVHVWNDTNVSVLHVETEVDGRGTFEVRHRLIDSNGVVVAAASKSLLNISGAVHLWSPDDPYLYRLVTEVLVGGKVVDRVETPYGIRTIRWSAGGPLLVNGRPVFINGIAEYEHLMGTSHAFSDEEIRSRALQIKASGFNAFRDAHQPHNLAYQYYWDRLGILWWPQLSAHIWYDTEEFRSQFKQLLTEWVKERRNSPSVILWGLQNESKLPADFARECTGLIRQLDPTASSQRKVTTCNGGEGTDWDVPQNWTGTYGGDPANYAKDLVRQVLVGEYGAWRTLELHGPEGFSENKMSQLMEMKIGLAESVKDRAAGHFFWLYNSHDNPGRVQAGEGERELDKVGPVNYKGLFTIWGEPTDAWYLYRSNFADKHTAPMAYIVSHTWPDRWPGPGVKDSIVVYSNCDEVELFNDIDTISLGRQRRSEVGTHFQWDGVNIKYNVLFAVGYVDGKAVAWDRIELNNLPPAPRSGIVPASASAVGYHYLYRVNCGGSDLTDAAGNLWMADRHWVKGMWGSQSWTDEYKGLSSFFGSQRKYDGGSGLMRDFRYGRDKLGYTFPVQDGEYLVELYFVEPWLGVGGGMDCRGMRLFDVAVNDSTVIRDLDIFKDAGTGQMLKKTVKVRVSGGQLRIHFPRVAAGEALISAIAIATTDVSVRSAPGSPETISTLKEMGGHDLSFVEKPVTTYPVGNAKVIGDTIEWRIEVGVSDQYSMTVKYRNLAAGTGTLSLYLENGTLISQQTVSVVATGATKWNYFTRSTETMINAGHYVVRLVGIHADELQVQ